jgi:hypothetical protein
MGRITFVLSLDLRRSGSFHRSRSRLARGRATSRLTRCRAASWWFLCRWRTLPATPGIVTCSILEGDMAFRGATAVGSKDGATARGCAAWLGRATCLSLRGLVFLRLCSLRQSEVGSNHVHKVVVVERWIALVERTDVMQLTRVETFCPAVFAEG